MRFFLAIGAGLLLLLSAGCSEKLSRQTGLTDADLLARGERMAERKKHAEAAESFQVLLERFPTSPLAPRAQFGLASSRMANKEDVEAEAAFDDFLKLYPSDPKAADALFLKGTLLSRQVLPPGRDQQKTRDAIQAFTQFAEKAPDSPLAAQVSEKIRSLRDRLALHEAAVVKSFLSRKLYDSAETRARRAVAEYPDVPAAPVLLSLLAESLERQGKKDEALAVRETVPAHPRGQGEGKR